MHQEIRGRYLIVSEREWLSLNGVNFCTQCPSAFIIGVRSRFQPDLSEGSVRRPLS